MAAKKKPATAEQVARAERAVAARERDVIRLAGRFVDAAPVRYVEDWLFDLRHVVFELRHARDRARATKRAARKAGR